MHKRNNKRHMGAHVGKESTVVQSGEQSCKASEQATICMCVLQRQI